MVEMGEKVSEDEKDGRMDLGEREKGGEGKGEEGHRLKGKERKGRRKRSGVRAKDCKALLFKKSHYITAMREATTKSEGETTIPR